MNIEQDTAICLKKIFCLNFSLFLKKKFQQMAVARSIFTLGGQVQLFWTAFDMPMTGVPLKVALGYKKIVIWVFKKIIKKLT